MKKLLFAAAIAASAAAFADGPINATAFANAGEYNPNDAGSYFYFAGESDSSMVTNTSPSTEKHTAYYATADDENYLALDTEGGTLWRSLAEIGITTDSGTNIYSLGTAQAVAAAGTYLDTLVQFTVTEDEAPEVGSGDKLAIWLQAGEGTTNLMVKANLYDFIEAPEATATSFVLAASEGTVTITPGEWYRLTVKAIPNVMNTDENGIIPAFEIYVDGIQMRATTPQFTADMVTMMTGMEVLSETASAAITANKLFPSLAEMGATGSTPTLQGVGFQGTGAVDEIVWTEEDPFPAAPTVVDFVLTLDTTDAHVDTISITTNGAPVVFDSGTAQIPSNTVVTIEAAPTFTDSYVLDTLTVGGISMTEFPTNFTMEADTTVAITSVLPVLNPTVDGTTVEPANVFNTAITTKPIVYPTAPTLAGTAGVDQTITFNGVTVNVPTYYDATLAGTTVSLSLNTNAIPAIGEATVESEEKAAIEVGATTFTTTLTTTNTKLYYGLKTATTPNAAEWTVGTLTQGTGAAMQIQADKPTVSGDTASAGFFKLYVTDVAPVTP